MEQLPLGSGNRKVVALSLATTDILLKEILKYSSQIQQHIHNLGKRNPSESKGVIVFTSGADFIFLDIGWFWC